jgi:hypothetical protein
MITGNFKTGTVKINGYPLPAKKSQEIINHSPDGFAWGYGGSGPAQLALALLVHYAGRSVAVELHQAFKWKVIAQLPQTDFAMQPDVIEEFLVEHKQGVAV